MSKIDDFLINYDPSVSLLVNQLREFIMQAIPGIREELDMPARLIGYGYGSRYKDTICAIILSKKGAKLGFYKGSELPDPQGLLEGSGKVHKYVVINTAVLTTPALTKLLNDAYKAYLIQTES